MFTVFCFRNAKWRWTSAQVYFKICSAPETNSLSSRDFSLISCHKNSAVNSASCLLINTVFGQNIAHSLGIKKKGGRAGVGVRVDSDNILLPVKPIKADREMRGFRPLINANKLIKIQTCAHWGWVFFSRKIDQAFFFSWQLDAAGGRPWDCSRTEADWSTFEGERRERASLVSIAKQKVIWLSVCATLI